MTTAISQHNAHPGCDQLADARGYVRDAHHCLVCAIDALEAGDGNLSTECLFAADRHLTALDLALEEQR